MKKVLVKILENICSLQHRLPDCIDEFMQVKVWTGIWPGYHCPFALWSAKLNKKWRLDVWRKPDDDLLSSV